ncbi:MAG: hypothetical protein ACXVCX_20355 [Ktedonobacterales bacterium]
MVSSTEDASGVRLPPASVLAPVFFLLGYVAMLISGFGKGLGTLQSLPIYIFFCFLLLMLQTGISDNRSVGRIIYIFVSSGFAIVYAGETLFDPSTGNFTRSPYTYIIINILLLAVFFYDAIVRRNLRHQRPNFGLAQAGGAPASPNDAFAAHSIRSPISYGALGTDFAGLAILLYISSFLVSLISRQQAQGRPWVDVDLNASLGLHLSTTIARLEALDLVLAFGATAASLLFLGLVGVLASSSVPAKGGSAVRSFGGSLRTIIDVAFREVLGSLRLVLGPLVWLIPAFCIGYFSRGVVKYFNLSAETHSASILDLFNPLSAASVANFGSGLTNLALGAVAFVAVVAAVAVVEPDGRLLRRTLAIFGLAGRSTALSLAFFIYSLAAVNAFAVLISATTAEPFQVGAPGLITLLASGAFILYSSLRERQRSRAVAAAATPVSENATTTAK